MSSLFSAITMAEWQALAAGDSASAAREIARRLRSILPDDQQRAAFATLSSQAEMAATFARVAGTIAPLAGVPYVLKDIFFTAGQPMNAGSNFTPGILPIRRSDSKLPHSLRGLGTILAAKTHLHEFAYGLTGENPHHGDCEHPRYPGRTSGGSSSGSAAAVAAGIVPLAVGTDTGGSIRVPAAFCGLYGLRLTPKDTYIEDAFPLAPSFDAAGWFTRNPADLTLVNRYLLGKPPVLEREPRGAWLDFAALGQTADASVSTSLKLAAEKFAAPADTATRDALAHAFNDAANAYSTLQSTEAYGVHAAWLDTHRDLYGKDVWARIDRGRRWSPAQLDAAHVKWNAVRAAWQTYFTTHDFLVMPATPFPALKKADCTLENRNRLLALTTPASLGGLAVLTIPITLPDGMSSGLQVIAPTPQSPAISWALKRSASC
ncbi:amidase [Nibricoccus aquaticus]|uniref:Amidase n=1 Tax=Nibricoccus aquaticus TaxID=2576891 RepID=A0A290QCG8_9BACT|nr:amidase [Nibricoccus aquaticus]ATC66224.1 amidase [Nibricoccus aquaticus]